MEAIWVFVEALVVSSKQGVTFLTLRAAEVFTCSGSGSALRNGAVLQLRLSGQGGVRISRGRGREPPHPCARL